MFLDIVNINVKGGRGGKGSFSFDRRKFIPRGGPDGGDGGQGGKVIIKTSEKMSELSFYSHKPLFQAENGAPGQKRKKAGKSGKDLILEVPLGTRIFNAENKYFLADMIVPDQEYIVAKGGKGGRGNVHFKSSTNRAPKYAEWGEIGEEKKLILELSVLIDIAIIGAPNSGKSSIINYLTKANAEVGDYPYTTKNLLLGVMDDDPPIRLVEIPAFRDNHNNLKYARHFQRAKGFILVVDVTSQESTDWLYDVVKIYSLRNVLIVFNKIDLLGSDYSNEQFLQRFEELFGHRPSTIILSMLSGVGLTELKVLVKELFNNTLNAFAVSQEMITEESIGEPAYPIVVKMEASDYQVIFPQLEKAISTINLETTQGVNLLQKKIKEIGLEKILIKEGIKPNDRVKIGDIWFTYLENE